MLSNIANKLGDPSQKVASKAIYCLGQLLHNHPAMKQVVLSEIEKLLFRPNVSTKAQYYAICFLTQFYLSHEDYELAKNLIDVYFSFFKACVKKVCLRFIKKIYLFLYKQIFIIFYYSFLGRC